MGDEPSLRESPTLRLDQLSDDAKLILGAHFGLMFATPGKSRVTFQTPWNRTSRAIAALDELVAAGVLTFTDGEHGRWARTYRALVDCSPSYHWMSANKELGRGFSVMVPDSQRRERPPRGWASESNRKDGSSPQPPQCSSRAEK